MQLGIYKKKKEKDNIKHIKNKEIEKHILYK